jgi:large subunit ribosomal protein L2
MAIKKMKPTSPGRRFVSISSFEEITKPKPEKSLTRALRKRGGRNTFGKVTMRHRGGGAKRRYRVVDFKRNKDQKATVLAIEYDPNRNCRIALIQYGDGQKRYIICPKDMPVGTVVESGVGADIKPGNVMPLSEMPVGSTIHCIEMQPGSGAQVARSAGASAQLLSKEKKYAYVRMPSGEIRLFLLGCRATIGSVGNEEQGNISLGKAGRSRHLGRKPKVRGVAQNPNDHPMGGGEGKSSGGRHPVSKWGTPSKGYRTRKRKPSDRLIIRRRSKS